MTIQNIEDLSTGFGISSALIANWTTLSEYKAGKIHLVYETLDRYVVVDNALAFSRIALEKLAYLRILSQLQSTPIKGAILLMPIALGYLKSRTQKTYPLLAKNLAYLESCVEKAAYATLIIGSIALVRFGHLVIGYSVLSTLTLNQIISNSFVKSHLPLLSKVDAVFKIYASPVVKLASVFIGGSYLTIGYALFSFALMAHESFTKPPTYAIIQHQANTQSPSSNKLTLEKWQQFNTRKEEIFLAINRERIPKITLSSLSENIDAKQCILDILQNLPEHLHANLISRVNHLPRLTKIQTFEEAKLEATTYLDQLILFTQEQSDPIWNTLLQHSCLALQKLNTSPDKQLSGIKELLFGNEGQCQIAQQRNLISGFLKVAEADQTILDGLELKFNLSLEALLRENFRYFLQADLEKNLFALEKTKISPLISPLRSFIDLTDIHIYQRYEKFYGPHFGINPLSKDLTSDSVSINAMSNPVLYLFMKYLFKFNTKDSSRVYFTIQLQRITSWLRNQIALKQSLSPSDISIWFKNWIENLDEEQKNNLPGEFEEHGTIAGHLVCDMKSGDIEPIALIAFLYGMDVFTESAQQRETISIQKILKDLELVPHANASIFEKVLNELDSIGIQNPSLAKTNLINYLFSEEFLGEEVHVFTNSLIFHEQSNISQEEQQQIRNSWKSKASVLKEEFYNCRPEAMDNLREHLDNIIYLQNLHLTPEILFVV